LPEAIASFTFATSRPSSCAARSMLASSSARRELEELVVHRPELRVAALRARLLGGDRGRHRPRVERQRVLAEREAELAERLLELLQGRPDALAERALEVGRLDDRDERVRVPRSSVSSTGTR
jgi:hypothetical protein